MFSAKAAVAAAMEHARVGRLSCQDNTVAAVGELVERLRTFVTEQEKNDIRRGGKDEALTERVTDILRGLSDILASQDKLNISFVATLDGLRQLREPLERLLRQRRDADRQ